MMLHAKNPKLRAMICGGALLAVVLAGVIAFRLPASSQAVAAPHLGTASQKLVGTLIRSHPPSSLQRHLLLRYKLVVLGTLGGPQSFADAGHGAALNVLNNGTVAGTA